MRFVVRAMDSDGGVVSVALDAPDASAALAQISARGWAALSARPQRAALPRRRRAADRFPLQQFAHELVALLRAGLSLPETLQAMVEKETRPEVRGVMAGIHARLFEGSSFSQALQDQPTVFPPLFIATAQASEHTGDLDEALSRYLAYQAQLEAVRKKIVSASIYPVVLLGVGALVTLFLLGYVVPRFSSIYAESGRDLPLLSRLLLDWGQLIHAHAWLIGLLLASVIGVALLFLRRLRRIAGLALAHLPALRDRVLVYHLTRMYRTLSMLLRGGIPIAQALAMVEDLLPIHLRDRLTEATRRVREGASTSVAMVEVGLSTPVAARMLRVGDRSGDMAGMMDRIASFHDDEMARWVDWFTKLFEPLLMAVIGIVIGGIVVLMYLPIFELAGSLQ